VIAPFETQALPAPQGEDSNGTTQLFDTLSEKLGGILDRLTGRGSLSEADVEAALKRFEAARLSENHRIIERARHLGAYLQASRTQEEQARAGRHSTDAAVIAETAVLDFLYA